MSDKKEPVKETPKKTEPKKKETNAGTEVKTEKPDATLAEDPKTDKEEESCLKDLMALSGHGGLFRFISQGRNGIIVEHLESKKRMQAFATMKVSALEDIAVYTDEEEIKLADVLASIHKYENGKETISPKSDPDELKDYFGAILPEYDRDRVYVSDIKKILGWYNLLLKHDLIDTEKLSSKPAGKSADLPAGKSTGKPAVKPASKPVGKSFGKPTGKQAGKSAGKMTGGQAATRKSSD